MNLSSWNAFLLGTLFLLGFSWFASIREKRFHGIPRFFVFEGILLLFLLNRPFWFRDAGAPHQLLSWVLLAASLYLAVHSTWLIYSQGKPQEGHLERTTRIVTTGLYRYLRHPMYASLFYLGTGIWLKDVNAVTTNLVLFGFLALLVTVKIEEAEMNSKFGYAYRLYKEQTKMFIPFLF